MFGEPRGPEATSSQISKSKEVKDVAIKMTASDFDILCFGPKSWDEEKIHQEKKARLQSYREFLDVASKYDIKFDMGDIEIDVDGERMTMTTDRNDFGTIVLENQ